ncbi:hypothetical protein AB6E53_06745 [Vibrio breoganii]
MNTLLVNILSANITLAELAMLNTGDKQSELLCLMLDNRQDVLKVAQEQELSDYDYRMLKAEEMAIQAMFGKSKQLSPDSDISATVALFDEVKLRYG